LKTFYVNIYVYSHHLQFHLSTQVYSTQTLYPGNAKLVYHMNGWVSVCYELQLATNC